MPAHPMDGKPAPEWTLKTWIQDGPLTVESLRGKPALIEFFSIVCAGCVHRSVPHSIELVEQYAPRGMQFVGINTVFESPDAQTVDNVRAFVEERKLPYPVALDDADETLARYLGLGTPTHILIDAQGIIFRNIFGSMAGPQQRLDYGIEELLS